MLEIATFMIVWLIVHIAEHRRDWIVTIRHLISDCH